MSKHIKEMVQNCRLCRVHSPTLVEPLQSSKLPEKAWTRLGSDIIKLGKKHYLIVVDYYSRYIEVRGLDSLTSASTINKLNSIFAAHGKPKLLISDNEPQFSLGEFQKFTMTYGFQHMTSSLKFSQCYWRG